MICDVCVNNYLADEKKGRDVAQRREDAVIADRTFHNNREALADIEKKKAEKEARFKKEQMDANQRHIQEKERRAAVLKSEDRNYVPPVIFGEENRTNNN